MRKKFSRWVRWEDRLDLIGIDYPGVYCLAITDLEITNNQHTWLSDICYIGMTNNKYGLKSRLYALHKSIESRSGTGHGGAHRLRYDHRNYSKLKDNLFVSIDWFDFDPSKNSVAAWRQKGDVASHEFYCIASYLKAWGDVPKYNKRESPKLK